MRALMLRFGCALAAMCTPMQSALAQTDDFQEHADRLSGTIGAGGAWAPRYPGADRYRLRGIPVIGVSYGRFFAGGDSGGGGAGGGLGVNVYRDASWTFGLALALGVGEARRESDHPSLEGTGDIDRATRLVASGGYTWRWLRAQLRIATDVSGKDQGTLAFFDVTARYRATEKLGFSAGPGVTWANDDYMMTFFGVTPEQSANSTLPAYQARGGVHMVRFGVNAGYRIDKQWSVGARLGTGSLIGDADGSPITRDRDQHLAAVFASYRF
jgi:MipA family protein